MCMLKKYITCMIVIKILLKFINIEDEYFFPCHFNTFCDLCYVIC